MKLLYSLLFIYLFLLFDLALYLDICHQLDDWVLCRIYKKKNIGKSMEAKEDYPIAQINLTPANNNSEQELVKFPRTSSLTHLLEMDYLGPISHILSDATYNSTFDFQINTANGGIDPFVKPQLVEIPYATDSGKYQVKQNSTINPTIFVNQVYDQRG